MRKVLFIFGTRPEAIKLCPLIEAVRRRSSEFQARVCVTGQHRSLLDQVLDVFAVRPDYDLDVMKTGQTLLESSSRMLAALEPVLVAEKPDLVVVQGDTTSTLCGALAAFFRRVPSAHVEAGLRTGDLSSPFPEEANRALTGRLTDLHFAATSQAADNLRREGIAPDRIFITGNTGIDALLWVAGRLEKGELAGVEAPAPGRKRIVVTAHRRESFGSGFERICDALTRLAQRPDVEIVYPAHPNPSVQEPVRRRLGGLRNVTLLEPLSYVAFVDLMRTSFLLLTDSGGVQEEGPSLGKPVLVMRDKTERPEAVAAGTAVLVGSDSDRIVAEAERLLNDPSPYAAMSRVHNPYGDGRAAARIVDLIASFFRAEAA
jgi:UDP-N-acetylglucosamine 2-epimerase (non-hydrolysing)